MTLPEQANPYTGEAWDGPSPNTPPVVEELLQAAYTPRARVWVTADASRSLGQTGWRNVPEVSCIQCGTPTRWTVLVAVQQSFPTIGEMAFRPVSVAVCPTCAQARDAVGAAPESEEP
jgi:hypothetical protein